MRIFKFGGASVKDAQGVKNVAEVLHKTGYDDIMIIVSAMGKMTNAFEEMAEAFYKKKDNLPFLIDGIRAYHYDLLSELYPENKKGYLEEIEVYFSDLVNFMTGNRSKDYNFIYDQMVSKAELISSRILSSYLNSVGIVNTWIDVRECIKTNSDYRDAKVDWDSTEKNISDKIATNKLYISQGFIAQDNHGNTTSLGREGSDYSAGIFAYCLDAESLTIWKDVKGVLNADPRYFKETRLLEQISYTEAIELAFFGASVIHPKTLQPLQKKEIPLYVKSFVKPKGQGTTVTRGAHLIPEIPCFIVKQKQILLSISTLDFSFIVEKNISEIFDLLHRFKMKVNLIQNSAISFSVCLGDKYELFDKLIAELESKFKIDFEKEVSLYTIRHFDKEAIHKIEAGNKVLLKQLSKETVQIVIQ